MLSYSFNEEIFRNIQQEPPLAQLEAFPLVLSLIAWERKPTPTRLQPLQVVAEIGKVSPEPSFLQARRPQLTQLLLVRHMLQTLHKRYCPSLDRHY